MLLRSARVVHYDPFSADAMSDPCALYRALRDDGPIHRLDEYDAWALPRFDEVWQVLQDRQHFSIVEGPIFDRDQLLAPHDGAPAAPPTHPLRSFSTLDPPIHTTLRNWMFPSFTPRATRDLADLVDELVRGQLDELRDRDRFDVVSDFAGPVSVLATLLFLGLPTTDAPALGTLVNQSTQREPGTPGRSSTARAAGAELHDRLRVHVAQRRVERGSGERPDLVDRLLDARLDDDTSLDDSEIATQLSTLLVGGAETLPKIIAGGLIRLAAHPQQRAELVAAPQLVQRAFEEVLRLEGVLQFVGRTATSEVTVAGTQVHPGQRVLLLLQSANRDEREFDEPDEFSIHRVSDRHLGFGHGVHFCIGAHPARLVGISLLQQLLARYPDYDVDLDAAERPPSEFQIGWTHLPLVGSPSTEPISG